MSSFLIIDDFFADPAAVREKALKAKYQRFPGEFPGWRSSRSWIAPEVHSLLKKNAILHRDGKIHCTGAKFQFNGKQHKGRRFIHTDLDYRYLGLVFLSEPVPGREFPGTSFYQHKQTGVDRVDPHNEKWAQSLSGKGNLFQLTLNAEKDRYQFNRWSEAVTLQAKFNRLLFFPAYHYHVNASAWGTTPANGRLVYSFYMDQKLPRAPLIKIK
jgi:hypothetical protein